MFFDTLITLINIKLNLISRVFINNAPFANKINKLSLTN